MYSFILRRILSTIPVLVIVAVLVFLVLRLAPGDPAAILAGDAASVAQTARLPGERRPERGAPRRSRPRQADPRAIRHLGRAPLRRRPRRILLLQDEGGDADR